jgi:hypothetical protein
MFQSQDTWAQECGPRLLEEIAEYGNLI